MFQQRMKEIEDDVLDWGFVDDGLGPAPITTSADTPWALDPMDRGVQVEEWGNKW